ncbi:N-acetyltransferase [candidate division GN15 bacterium]|nr:N-acetyltransferase [candidate division GN15 bacterium]
MASVDVIEVESRAQLKQFITYPNRLYADEPNYVAPLITERLEFFDKDKNPFYRTATTKLFLAVREGEVVGRCATCINYRHNEFHMEKTGFFGFFDTPDDYDIARPLLKVAMITLKKAGMEKMRGPMNFSTNHEIGFLVDGFDKPPMVMMPYNQPHQPRLAEQFGMKKVMDVLAHRLDKDADISPRVLATVEKLMKRSRITVRSLRMKEFDREIQRVKDIYNQAWQYNWGFVPMDDDEFAYMAKNLRQIVDPDLVFIAEADDQPIGFLLALPDINQALRYLNGKLLPFGLIKLLWHTKVKSKIDSLRMITMGVVPDFQKRAVDSMLYVAMFRKGVEKGYDWAELSWMLETNQLVLSAVTRMGAREYKRYRIVEMPI